MHLQAKLMRESNISRVDQCHTLIAHRKLHAIGRKALLQSCKGGKKEPDRPGGAKAVAGLWAKQRQHRFDPRLADQGKNPLQMDSKAPTLDFEEYAYSENRYRSLQQAKPEVAAALMKQAKNDTAARVKLMQQLANLSCDCDA